MQTYDICFVCEVNLPGQIENHHILPRSMKGCDDLFNRVPLCPTCHSKVYVEGCLGQHGVLNENNLIIDKWYYSTRGRLLHYFLNGEEFFKTNW